MQIFLAILIILTILVILFILTDLKVYVEFDNVSSCNKLKLKVYAFSILPVCILKREIKNEKKKQSIKEKIEPLKQIISGENPNVFVSFIILQDNSNETNEPESRFAVLIYNKADDKVGVISTFDVSESDHKKLKEKGIILLNADKQKIGPEFMNYIKGENTEIVDKDVYESIYLIMRPDLMEQASLSGITSIFDSIGSSTISSGDLENPGLIHCIEKIPTKTNLIDKIQDRFGM